MFRRFSLIVFLAVSLLLAGCSSSSSVFYELSAPDADTLVLENYVPANETAIFMAARIDAADHGGAWFRALQSAFADYGLSYREDIEPLIPEDGGRLALAMIDRGADEPGMLAAITATDDASYERVTKVFERRQEFAASEYKNKKILANAGAKVFMTKIDGLVFIANSMDGIRALIDAPGGVEKNLREDMHYDELTGMVTEDYLHWFYMNHDAFHAAAANVEGPIGTALQKTGRLAKQAVFTQKRDNGLELSLFAVDKDGKLQKKAKKAPSLYMAEHMPGQNILFFSEQANFAKWLHKQDGMIQNLSLAFSAFGLDYPKEGAPLIAKNVAFGIYTGEFALPSFVVMSDVSSAQKQAQKLIDMLGENLAVYVAGFNQTTEDVMRLETVGDFRRLSFDFHRFAEVNFGGDPFFNTELLARIAPETIELWFGVHNKMLTVALHPDFDTVLEGNTLADDSFFADLTDSVGRKGQAQTIINIAEIVKALDVIFDVVSQGRPELVSEQQKKQFDDIKAVLRPYAGLIMLNQDEQGGLGKGYLLTQ